MSSLQKEMMKGNRGPAALPKSTKSGGISVPGVREYFPILWSEFFQAKEYVDVGNGEKFCVYRQSNSADPGSPIMLLLHGGGHSALTWCKTVEALMSIIECEVVAVDLRGHGETKTDSEDNLASDCLTRDMIAVVKALHIEDRPLIVVGHSLGGALAIHLTTEVSSTKEMTVIALIVIDVVEGTAMDSLTSMNFYLKHRPKSFASMSKAIEWCVRSGQIRNLDSARVSMPGQLKNMTTNEPATLSIDEHKHGSPKPSVFGDGWNGSNGTTHKAGAILEEEGDEDEDATDGKELPSRPNPILEGDSGRFVDPHVFTPPSPSATPCEQSEVFTWRIDLSKTEPYWTGWFHGLSSKFLDTPCPKLLLLAGVDRLDRDLTVGQMQGKFQMQVLNNVGHAVQEDSPEEVAMSMAQFLVRHKLVVAKIEFPRTLPGC